MDQATPDITESMRTYYAQRAAYYERVYLKPERQDSLRAMESWLPGVFAGRRVLEVAAGTGWWTPHAAREAVQWLATDLNPETLAVARGKALPACVQLAEVDAYSFEQIQDQTFDGAFAGCWWSHVPLSRLPSWLERLHQRLEPGSRVVMLDNRYVQSSITPLSRRDAEGNTYQNRSLDDGSVHEVLKNFPSREQAFTAIGPRAKNPEWIDFEHYWVLSYLLD